MTSQPEGRPAGKQRQVTESGKAQVVLGMSPRPGSVNNGLTTRVTRKGYAVPGDRRNLPQGEASIKKDGGRRSVTGAERQSKAEPDEDGKALGGSAVHYKRTRISPNSTYASLPALYVLGCRTI
jgi:hypothetical protein